MSVLTPRNTEAKTHATAGCARSSSLYSRIDATFITIGYNAFEFNISGAGARKRTINAPDGVARLLYRRSRLSTFGVLEYSSRL